MATTRCRCWCCRPCWAWPRCWCCRWGATGARRPTARRARWRCPLERAARGRAAQGRAGTAGGVNWDRRNFHPHPVDPPLPHHVRRTQAAAQPAPAPIPRRPPAQERFADRRRAHAQPHGHPATRHRADPDHAAGPDLDGPAGQNFGVAPGLIHYYGRARQAGVGCAQRLLPHAHEPHARAQRRLARRRGAHRAAELPVALENPGVSIYVASHNRFRLFGRGARRDRLRHGSSTG